MTTHLEQPTDAGILAGSNGRSSVAGAAAPSRPRVEVPRRRGAEPYDALLWRMWARRPDATGTALLLGFTGCTHGAGVSTLAANLAIRAADHGLGPVLLVDANRHTPALRKLVRGESRGGLCDVLAGSAAIEACICASPVAGLDVLPFGAAAAGMHIEAYRLGDVLSPVRERYSLAIFDYPAAEDLGPALPLVRAMDATVLVMRSSRVRKHAAEQTARNLSADGIALAGAVLTDQLGGVPNWLDRLI